MVSEKLKGSEYYKLNNKELKIPSRVISSSFDTALKTHAKFFEPSQNTLKNLNNC